MKSFFLNYLAKAASLKKVLPAQEIDVKADLIVGHDGTWPGLMPAWEKNNYQLCKENKTIFTVDHAYPAPNETERIRQKELSIISEKKGCLLYNHGEGVLHQILAEKEIPQPGMIIVGADGHVATAGAFGALAFAVSPEQLVPVLASGYYRLKVPETVTFSLEGKPKKAVMARDVALYLIGEQESLIRGRAVCLTGSYITNCSLESKMTICNLLPEAGAVTAFILPATMADPEDRIDVDVTGIVPMIAVPSSPTAVKKVHELSGIKIDVAVIGGCSSGRLEDMLVTAKALKGTTVHNSVTMIVTPASRRVANEMDRLGLSATIRNSGAIIMPPGCGSCPGKHFGILAPNDIAITTTIRNSAGRMGSAEAQIYLASPLTVVKAAVKGVI